MAGADSTSNLLSLMKTQLQLPSTIRNNKAQILHWFPLQVITDVLLQFIEIIHATEK